MFLVEYHKDMGVDPQVGMGCHKRTLRLFKTLQQAIVHRKSLTPIERHCCQTREANEDDFWELAQEMYTLAADAVAKKDYRSATVRAAKASVFLELAAGHEVDADKFDLLIYAEVEKGDGHG